jgi:hypothetical protein
MKRQVENWTVERLNRERQQISFPEYQREKALWSTQKKISLIDSILVDIDIPKLYFYFSGGGNYEVIDGQQRLWSIWQFLNDEYPFTLDGRQDYFSKMRPKEKKKINEYIFQITVIEGADDDYLRLLFVRLQLGLLLVTGELLNAATGKMKKLVFDQLVKHPFIRQLGVPKRRFAKQTLCAQVCINSFTREKLDGRFARTRYDDLKGFFNEYADPKGKDLERFSMQSEKISDVFDQLQQCFGANANKLKNRSYILSIYLLMEELIYKEGSLPVDQLESFSIFAFQLWERLREESRLGIDRTDRELYKFQSYLSSAPGERFQIENRHQKLWEYYGSFQESGKIKGDG